jgi:shikimate kinase
MGNRGSGKTTIGRLISQNKPNSIFIDIDE